MELEQLNGKLRLLVEILETRSRVMNDDRLDGLARFARVFRCEWTLPLTLYGRTFDEKAKLIAQKLDRSMASRIIETSQDRTFIAREVSSVMFAIEIAMVSNLSYHWSSDVDNEWNRWTSVFALIRAFLNFRKPFLNSKC